MFTLYVCMYVLMLSNRFIIHSGWLEVACWGECTKSMLLAEDFISGSAMGWGKGGGGGSFHLALNSVHACIGAEECTSEQRDANGSSP